MPANVLKVSSLRRESSTAGARAGACSGQQWPVCAITDIDSLTSRVTGVSAHTHTTHHTSHLSSGSLHSGTTGTRLLSCVCGRAGHDVTLSQAARTASLALLATRPTRAPSTANLHGSSYLSLGARWVRRPSLRPASARPRPGLGPAVPHASRAGAPVRIRRTGTIPTASTRRARPVMGGYLMARAPSAAARLHQSIASG